MIIADRPPSRLLVVDDIADNREILVRFFTRRGYLVDEADCGEAALDLVRRASFDAILLDVVMPGIDGFEVLKRLRTEHSRSMLPVIMVTARAESKDIAKGLELGANDYITKPIDFSIAQARVESQLERLHAERALAVQLEKLKVVNHRLEHEIGERQQSESAMRHMALHDALTGLGNRLQFRERMMARLKGANASPLTLLFLDLDQFKLINDTLGHRIGDLLLQAVAERLREATSPEDILVRLGGDEFAVARSCNAEHGSALAMSIMESVATGYVIDGHHIRVTCSIGIAHAPDHGSDFDQILASADLALYRAKDEGRARYRVFEPEMNERARARLLLQADLAKGLEQEQFELHYQPLLDVSTETISGFEALLRWRHPLRGFIPPLDFIPLAEETTLIVALGRWILFEACREAMRWPASVKVAVNFSAKQFLMGTPFKDVSNALAASGLSPDRLELEITETLLLEEEGTTLEALHELRRLGVRISMDDFGTGYSSLKYLRTFPFDKIKIDRSFVRDLPSSKESAAIVCATLGLAQRLGIVTTGEGVETREQLDYLRREGCTQIQGYLISPAITAAAIPEFLTGFPVSTRKVA